MLSGMKPLPKALIIAAPIVLAVFLYVKFVPEKKVEVVEPVATQAAPTEPVIMTVVPTEPVPVVVEQPQDAGMKALLEKGKK